MPRNMDEEVVLLWSEFGIWLKHFWRDVPDDPDSIAMAAKTTTCMMRETVPEDLMETANDPTKRVAWLNSIRPGGGPSLYQILHSIRLANRPHPFTPGSDTTFCGLCGESAGGSRHLRRKNPDS